MTENDDNTMGYKERPILFSGPMVRALLGGRKTQTRRLVKPQPARRPGMCHHSPTGWAEEEDDGSCLCNLVVRGGWWPRQRLWVRETWRTYASLDICAPSAIRSGAGVQYEAGGSNLRGFEHLHGMGKVRQSIFMPRWASRITLEVTAVRAERLQDVSEADALAEGVGGLAPEDTHASARDELRSLWDNINGKRAPWESNPWVWVVEFARREGEA